jgi:hypothetical protein
MDAAKGVGESLRCSIAQLAIANSESIAADHITASVAVATARVRSGVDRVKLMTRALASAQSAAASGGDRLIAISGENH